MVSGSANLVAFEQVLDERGIVYSEVSNPRFSVLKLCYSTENIEQLNIFFWFDEDGESVRFGSGAIAHVPDDRIDVVLRTLNDMNLRYRWLKFGMDSDNDVLVSGDSILSSGTVGSVCFELLGRTLNICDGVYPELVKAICM